MRVFIDSDVVISSLLSSKGAAYTLLYTSDVTPVISSLSVSELRVVCKRMHMASGLLEGRIREKFEVVIININPQKMREKYQPYVTDTRDAHIVAGAAIAKTKYLISYNLRHFKAGKIKSELDILLMTPALTLQYLRSH